MSGSGTSEQTVSTALRHRDKAARRSAGSGGGSASAGGGAAGAVLADVDPAYLYASDDVDIPLEEIDISS